MILHSWASHRLWLIAITQLVPAEQGDHVEAALYVAESVLAGPPLESAARYRTAYCPAHYSFIQSCGWVSFSVCFSLLDPHPAWLRFGSTTLLDPSQDRNLAWQRSVSAILYGMAQIRVPSSAGSSDRFATLLKRDGDPPACLTQIRIRYPA
jgi:hypothetical protein